MSETNAPYLHPNDQSNVDAAPERNSEAVNETNPKYIGTYPPLKYGNDLVRNAKWPKGAYLALDDGDVEVLECWLKKYDLSATPFQASEFDEFLDLILAEQVTWVAAASAGKILEHSSFDQLFRTLMETDTELWTADGDCRLTLELALFAERNYEFLAPYLGNSDAGVSLTSISDTLRRIEARQLSEGHHQRTSRDDTDPEAARRMRGDLIAQLSPKERRLYEATDTRTPYKVEELSQRAGCEPDGSTRTAIGTLRKMGLVRNQRPHGYLRAQ